MTDWGRTCVHCGFTIAGIPAQAGWYCSQECYNRDCRAKGTLMTNFNSSTVVDQMEKKIINCTPIGMAIPQHFVVAASLPIAVKAVTDEVRELLNEREIGDLLLPDLRALIRNARELLDQIDSLAEPH